MAKALLSRQEAKNKLKLNHLPECSLSEVSSLEKDLFKRYIGSDLYEKLLADLNDYSDKIEFNPATTYTLGDVVIYGGVYVVSDKVANDDEPMVDWSLADKFQKECYNDLWCDGGLCEYLSRKLVIDSLPGTIATFTGDGLTVPRNRDSVPADKDERSVYIAGHEEKARRLLRTVLDFITDNESCFSDIEIDCNITSEPIKGVSWVMY